MFKEFLIEDFYKTIDVIIIPVVKSLTIFLLLVALIAFILTLSVLFFKSMQRQSFSETFLKGISKTKIYCTIVKILFIILLVEVLISLAKVVINRYYTPVEHIVAWIFYYVYVVVLVACFANNRNSTKAVFILLPSSIILLLSIYRVNLGIAVTEDMLDILQILKDGYLRGSFHAIHYDVAPLHTFMYVILGSVLGTKPLDSTPFVLIGVSLGWVFLLYLYSTIKRLQGDKIENFWILSILPFLLFIHPYSFGGLLTSYVNSFSYTPVLILLLNILSKFKNYSIDKKDLMLAFILIVVSILMHPMGFAILLSSIFALFFAIYIEISSKNAEMLNNLNSIKIYLRYITIFAVILFVIKSVYTGLRYGLETFFSDVLKALFATPYGGDLELTPRTYSTAPFSSLYSYTFALGFMAALFLYHLLEIFRRRARWINIFNITIYVLILTLATISVLIVSQSVPSKYIVGTLIPLVPISFALDLIQFSSNKILVSHGKKFLIISIIFIASLGTLTSPLILFSHYRFTQGANPASDLDYITATQIISMISPNGYIEYRLVYNPQWPYNTPSAIETVLNIQKLFGHKMIYLNINFDTILNPSYSLVYSGFNSALEVATFAHGI